MSVIARRVISIPQRPATETWDVIAKLLAPDQASDAYKELKSIEGIASSIISRETIGDTPIVVAGGGGPRVRIYGIFGIDAISGEGAQESSLASNPTEGEWKMSLPCPTQDLKWISDALKEKSKRITARDESEAVDFADEEQEEKSLGAPQVNMEAFLRK